MSEPTQKPSRIPTKENGITSLNQRTSIKALKGAYIKVLSGKEVVVLLRKNGYAFVRQRGSHVQLQKVVEGVVRHVTVGIHGNHDPPPFELRSIIRQAGITPEEFEGWMK